ncbi:unnamed protein product, partial [Meganyctiphanes norvegica]
SPGQTVNAQPSNMGRELRIRRVDVTTPVQVGASAWLKCEWESASESIYTLKWYNGLHEFYRWTPAERPPIKVFPFMDNMQPFTVDENVSKEGRVRILDLSLNPGDSKFRCEVSDEAPSFHTDSKAATMMVIDPPDERPHISGVRYQGYITNQPINLNCTSRGAKPPANLTFYINDIKADPQEVFEYPPRMEDFTDRSTSIVSLHTSFTPRLVRDGQLKVKCAATISSLYYEASEEILHSRESYRAPFMEGQVAAGSLTVSPWRLEILTLICGLLLHQ